MFKPSYTISNKLLAGIKEASILASELNSVDCTEAVLLEFQERARISSSYSSTSIEGNPLALTEVKKILKAKPENIRDTQQEVLNYNEALNFIAKQNKAGKLVLNLEFILQVQAKVMNKLLPKAKLGKLRKEPVVVNNPQTGKTIYLCPDWQELRVLMKGLVDFINKNSKKIDPLILAGIFHKQLVIIHPFIDGNGRTTRLITQHLLTKLGFNTFNLFSFENYYNNNVSNYFEKVGVRGDYYDIADQVDFTEWLEYFVEGILDELHRVKKELLVANKVPQMRLLADHKKIIKYIENHGSITDQEYSKLTKRAKATRVLDFKKLIGLNIVERRGVGRSTYYVLSQN